MPGQSELHQPAVTEIVTRRHNSVPRPRHGSGLRLSVKPFGQGSGDASSSCAIAALECEALRGLVRIGNAHEAGAKSPKLS
ncbi:unnamed protein product [Fusarium graminearum]|uniref:Chromosome 2, complete genome n=2 Tax=Gibberella zeae TaxID=5518 RepID=A0A098DEQ7_GIBZE|nr:unnamed protein product [Fusarium graminearum]CAF3526982.1 unnamed protein product [Fusarium graminearum]CAG1963001.1 unnamed protein product [Fusarium graminearum]CAG1976186.1 unnamed protein product [Fusarium graminearum]CEF77463.1 unnamed protein product [Fusarium graminearum]